MEILSSFEDLEFAESDIARWTDSRAGRTPVN